MTVKDMIRRLEEYNPNAEVFITTERCACHTPSFSFGYDEGCTKADCQVVHLSAKEIENNERLSHE